MAFTGKTSPGSRVYVLFAMKCKRLRKKDIIEQVNISRASLYQILKQKKDAKRKKVRASEDTVFGRPRKLRPREERMLLRKIHPLRKAEEQFTVKRLIREAGINSTNVSCRTIQRFLCSKLRLQKPTRETKRTLNRTGYCQAIKVRTGDETRTY